MRAALATGLLIASLPAGVGANDRGAINLAAERAAIEAFQAADQQLQDVGWQLTRGNAEFCDQRIPAIGLQLQDLASYGAPEIARAALGLTGDFAVQTAARGSPAGESGMFAANREIMRLADADPNAWEAGDRLHWQRLTRAHDWIDLKLAQDSAIMVTFADGEAATLEPVPVCASRFELMGESRAIFGREWRAVADGARVVIGIEFTRLGYAEAVFAGVVAHELAHNLLGHRAWLDRNGRSRSHRRLTEREADRLMPWLLANAGYDPAAAVTFWESWGPGNDGGLFRRRTHDGWDERAEFVAAEIPQIRALMASEGRADWSVHFRREIDPDEGL